MGTVFLHTLGSVDEIYKDSEMDAIKKKMEKLTNETADAEARIAKFEEIKAANELEADKFEDQLRVVQKKMQATESSYDVCIEDLFNQTVKLEEMEKKAGNAESEVSGLRSRLILLQENNEKQEERLAKGLTKMLRRGLSWKMEFLLMRSQLTILTNNLEMPSEVMKELKEQRRKLLILKRS